MAWLFASIAPARHLAIARANPKVALRPAFPGRSKSRIDGKSGAYK